MSFGLAALGPGSQETERGRRHDSTISFSQECASLTRKSPTGLPTSSCFQQLPGTFVVFRHGNP